MYNGHKSKNYWNVSLWISNDEGLYNLAKHLVKFNTKDIAARKFVEEVGVTETPDGAPYTVGAVRAALRDL